ncbi:MAG: hypothetical protein K9M75_11080 [Phycisphaerae bacterium]|nr:hypothetical protein [Phycisphaerae bacterium]
MKFLKNKLLMKVIIGLVLFSPLFGLTALAGDPCFNIDDPIKWEKAIETDNVKPIARGEWDEYMLQWQSFTEEGDPYPQNEFFNAELYVYGGSGEDNDVGGLVMKWGENDPPLPNGSYSSAFVYDYLLDPDLTNCTISITVLAPQFNPATNSQINAVSLGMKDIGGAVRGWQWACGSATSGAPITWGVPTTITVNTSLTGVTAATPTASGYMNNPGFDITKVMKIIVDENANWNWQGVGSSVPPPGTILFETPWNLWRDLSVSKNPPGQINVGINIDVHQGNQDIVANDYHISGRIESGMPDGNWANPPVLVENVNGQAPFIFPNFAYSITPDTSDPAVQNWYKFTAEWSGLDVPYCTKIHLGLLFDVTCHNIIIDLVGWWTKDGVQISQEPIIGFDVQDGILTSTNRQTVRLKNGVVPTEIVAMELVSLPPGTDVPFEQLREGTPLVEGLPWIPLANERGIINDNNRFHIDSFFDVFVEIEIPGPPLEPGGVAVMQPVRIEPGGLLILRQNIPYIDGQGIERDRWFFEIHEAHERASDLGDAPDKTNSHGLPMTAYPAAWSSIPAYYPTVYSANSPPYGPLHRQPTSLAFLGKSVTSETEADIGPDADGVNNIDPMNNKPDLDFADDGVLGLPFTLTSCKLMKFNYLVNVITPNNVLYANVWFDWNRDGDWDDSFNCQSNAAGVVTAPEWAVQNQQLIGLPVGLNTVTSLPFRPYTGFDAAGNQIPEDHPIWMRITLSDQKWQPGVNAGMVGEGGSGPQNGYRFGETEDYYFVPKKTSGNGPDLDSSGIVDLGDFVILASQWLQSVP